MRHNGTSTARIRTRSARVKVEDVKRGRNVHRVNGVAARMHEKGGVRRFAPECYQEAVTGARFERWVESKLLAWVPKGNTIIMDNAGFHRKEKLTALCKKAGVGLLFLPPYSPDLNPIEKDWANMKHELRDSAPLCDLLETAMYHPGSTGKPLPF